MKKFFRNVFGLHSDHPISFHMTDWAFRKILRNNPGVKWPVHHTSSIIFPERIIRGKNVFPGDSPGNYIQAINGITIGDFTNIGPNVAIISANHDLFNNKAHLKASPILIGSHCWIGANAVILPAVQLGDFTIVGAGAVVTKSFKEGYCVIAGNPAKIIKELDREQCRLSSKSY